MERWMDKLIGREAWLNSHSHLESSMEIIKSLHKTVSLIKLPVFLHSLQAHTSSHPSWSPSSPYLTYSCSLHKAKKVEPD